jgi:hypothetical protein
MTDLDEFDVYTENIQKIASKINTQPSMKDIMEIEEQNDFSISIPAPIPVKPPGTFVIRIYSTPTTCNEIFANFVNNLFENPEGRMTNSQNAVIFLFTCFEAYRTIISSFLVVFVPQNCGGYSCTILQNIMPKDDLEIAAIFINSFMALYFCAMFSIERMRETLIKEYFIADKSYPTDKDYLVKMISEMKSGERRKILGLNRVYRIFAHSLLFVFFVNAAISFAVLNKNYLNNTTTTAFVTNALFMINRIYKALKVTSSGEYNIYSAYRTDSILYNRYRNGEWFPIV